MSIKIKLPFLVFVAFAINFVLLNGYYRFYLSSMISQDNSQVQRQLQQEAVEISSVLKDKKNLSQELNDISKRMNLIIRVEDESGNTIFHTGSEEGINLELNASSIFKHDGNTYLLRVIRPILLTKLSSFEVARSLFRAEILIICFILFFIYIAVYFIYVKPIITLQKAIEYYKSGVRPQKGNRGDEIGILQNEFSELADMIEEEKQKQSRMIASISHDIKTPLTSVMGYAERLKKNTLSQERHELYVNTIYNNSVSIKNLIDEFDEYLSYQIQSELKLQIISVEQLCGILRMDYQEELGERGIDFSVDTGCSQEMLSIDISKMRRVFGNIISNSLKHFGTVKPSIAVSCRRQGDCVLCSVEDNGTGIKPEDNLKKIFDPFYTSDKGRTVAGLGLSICKEIVEAHNGRILAQNKESGGLCIQICLPVYKK